MKPKRQRLTKHKPTLYSLPPAETLSTPETNSNPKKSKDHNYVTFRTTIFVACVSGSLLLVTFGFTFVYGMGKDAGRTYFDKEKNGMADTIRILKDEFGEYRDSCEGDLTTRKKLAADEAAKNDSAAKKAIPDGITYLRGLSVEQATEQPKVIIQKAKHYH